MIYGVWIDDINTLTDYGLMLCADVSVSSPEPRLSYVSIPEGDGDLDITAALTGGEVRYGMRTINFTLFAAHDIISGKPSPATEQHMAMVRSRFAAYIHGQKRKLWLPDDPEHYYYGRIRLGNKGGYNNGRIPITMTADPWRYRNDLTKFVVSEDMTVKLTNEGRRVSPVFRATDATAHVLFGEDDYQILPGDNRFEGLLLETGGNDLTFSNVTNAITISYQEAVL